MSVYTYRLSTNLNTTPHAYEVGMWPDGSDTLDPAQYVVVETVWGQEAAAARAAYHSSIQMFARKGERHDDRESRHRR
jgi:hypothetical protein